MNISSVVSAVDHFYQTGNSDYAILSEGSTVTIVHKHSSILTCRGFDHVVVIPWKTDQSGSVTSDSGPVSVCPPAGE